MQFFRQYKLKLSMKNDFVMGHSVTADAPSYYTGTPLESQVVLVKKSLMLRMAWSVIGSLKSPRQVMRVSHFGPVSDACHVKVIIIMYKTVGVGYVYNKCKVCSCVVTVSIRMTCHMYE